MAEKHSDVCEDAEPGSECDCPCAGRRHAVKHTKGGMPGAGTVSKRARAIAERDGRAPVTGNPGRADGTAGKAAKPAAKDTPPPPPPPPAPAKPPATPAAKVPAPLRRILDVIDNPRAHEDTNAAARYEKITAAHLALMTPEQKQAMLDDLISRAGNGYKAKSPTGQKLTRAHEALLYAPARVKVGMRGAPKLPARAGDEVTHPQHGHGKVKTTTMVNGKSQAVVDFGDKTETLPQTSLTFGHVGDDTNRTAKDAAKVRAGAARNAAGQAKLTGFADGLAEHRRKSRDDSMYKFRSDRFDPLAEFNRIQEYPAEVFQSLPPADKAKVLAALDDVWNTVPSADVRKRVAKVLKAWAGQDREVPRDPDPEHVLDAKRALDGGRTTLPRSMVYANVSKQSLQDAFTPQQRAKMRADAGYILDKMSANAQDRKGLQRVVDDLDAIDPPTVDRSGLTVTSSRRGRDDTSSETKDLPTKSGDTPAKTVQQLTSQARDAERDSLDASKSWEQRDAARTRMHELERQIFAARNPWRTPGPGADKFQGKKVRDVPATQQPVLEAIGSHQGMEGLTKGKSLPTAALNQLQLTGHITTVFSTGAAYLAERGHVKLAAQRGDGRHQQMNEEIARLENTMQQAQLARDTHGQVPLRQKDQHWSRRSREVHEQEQAAYAAWMTARTKRDEYLKTPPAGGNRR